MDRRNKTGEPLSLFNELDDAVIGVGEQFPNIAIVVYSRGKIVEAIMHDGTTSEQVAGCLDCDEQIPLALDDEE